MSGTSSSDNNALLAAIISTIQSLQTQQIPQPNSTEAARYQSVNLAPLESNANPLSPGLSELFEFATENMQADLTTIDLAIKNGQIPNPATIIHLSTPLHDCWASFQVLNYLLYLSAYLGYPAPAAQFFAPIIPKLNAQLNPSPIIVPQPSPPRVPSPPPVPTPIPTPSPPPSPPPGPPTPTPTPTPSPPPSPPSATRLKVGKVNLYSGSGEPGNAGSLTALSGVTMISIPINALMPTQTSTTVDWDSANNPTIVGGNIDQIVQAYQAVGLKVMLELQCDCADGTPRSQFFPTNAVTFITNLQSLAVALAQNATRLGCVAISIAPQLFPSQNSGDHPASYMVQWNNLYAATKAVFASPVLYVAAAANVGPKDSTIAMDWTSSWDAIGVRINPPIGSNVTAATIQNYWRVVNDTEASAYAAPVFGASGWLATLAAAWVTGGKQLYIESGFAASAG